MLPDALKGYVDPFDPILTKKLAGETVDNKDVLRYLHPEIRRISDNDLETERVYLMREIVELRQKKLTAKYYEFLLELYDEERDRRKELAKHGAPMYKGRSKADFVGVADLKQHYTGEAFLNLFYSVTGFEIFFGGGRYKYRCLIHGEDNHPSGVLDTDRGLWYCHGCGKGGDIFSLLNLFPPYLSFTDALKQLKEWANPYMEVKPGKFRRKRW